jgi:hypothetical protein
MVDGNFQMEVRRGLVYPRETMLDNIQINALSYAMVKMDMVHENSKELKLKVPTDDTMLTLRVTVTRRVQWRRTSNSSFNVDHYYLAKYCSCFDIFSDTSVSISNLRAATSVPNSRATASVSNSKAAVKVSNSRAVAEASTSDSKYPAPYN